MTETCPVCGSEYEVKIRCCENCRFSKERNQGSRLYEVRCRIQGKHVPRMGACEAHRHIGEK